LVDLARHFGIPSGQSHRALDDTLALAHVTLALGRAKQERARKTALTEQLGHLGVALGLHRLAAHGPLTAEGALFAKLTRVFALGRYSGALDFYESQRDADGSQPTLDAVIAQLGGVKLMEKIRAAKTADDRYPQAMQRLRRLIDDLPAGAFQEQLTMFLERIVLSQWQGVEQERDRVNLLTLHTTKGLEFSRVYIVGVEDAQLPGGTPLKPKPPHEVEEGRRLLYVGMTRTKDRLVLTTTPERGGIPTGNHRFLDEMNLPPQEPS
jgi:superfamily I DNA/RNA helicase